MALRFSITHRCSSCWRAMMARLAALPACAGRMASRPYQIQAGAVVLAGRRHQLPVASFGITHEYRRRLSDGRRSRRRAVRHGIHGGLYHRARAFDHDAKHGVRFSRPTMTPMGTSSIFPSRRTERLVSPARCSADRSIARCIGCPTISRRGCTAISPNVPLVFDRWGHRSLSRSLRSHAA